MSTTVDPTLISSSVLFILGASLITIVVLALVLIEGKKTRAQTKAVLDASVQRHLALLQEHRDELEILEHFHREHLAETAKHQRQEIESLMEILAISDQERDAALANACRDQKQVELMQARITYLTVLMETWATGDDATASVVRKALRRAHFDSQSCMSFQ
ncbi:hypothetical protein [Pseudomonas veronii]